ncbi:MAG: 1-deoxy-D-xylulose-5-phosphate synthase [Deltaproteobacteria bacterium]|jgi:1-deoxy-D-xylulose-5-phosphate synthase|nr:1-deoxy-D-xylulose-5-phosphate synthase [Deltaproteobacteria bacterium]
MAEAAASGGILAQIGGSAGVAGLEEGDLPLLAQEIRTKIIDAVSRNGGHLASPLGVVELTIALLRKFDPVQDRIIWDVGHQAYAYKILTGRAENFNTLRQAGGISGFPRRAESPCDHFGTGHASTSISAAMGMVMAREQAGKNHQVIAVVGDGALTGGMVYEAMNHAGALNKPLIVFLNDNQMSISKNVGALSFFLSRKFSSQWLRKVKKEVSSFLKSIPGVGDDMFNLAERSRQSFKSFFTPGILFEALRFDYVGPVNGHDFAALSQAMDIAASSDRPILVHILTQKGKGYEPAENAPADYHGVGRFNPATGEVESPGANAGAQTYTNIFASSLCRLAAEDDKIVAVTAAMPDGTGLSAFAGAFPSRFYDVGICEQHAVTFAAGLATQGFKPVVAVYSTFLQRAYDQVVHDVCLQNLPVVFALDRAGLVGEDGPTHHGVFDIAYLRHIPHLSILAPRDRETMQSSLAAALRMNSPVAVRYPRGECPVMDKSGGQDVIQPGKGAMLRGSLENTEGGKLVVIAVGGMAHPVCLAVDALRAEEGIEAAVFDPVWLKPLPQEHLLRLAENYPKLLVVEEHVLAGGFGSALLEHFNENGLPGSCSVYRHGLPDSFIEHGKAAQLRAPLKLDVPGLRRVIREILEK